MVERKGILIVAFLMIVLTFTLYFLTNRQAEAACGASVSSCKSCHEVKKQMPVLNSGAWHSDHAFGDFCEFCHGGVVSAPSKEEAHTGMVKPFDNLKNSCSSCHVTDLEERASTYGVSLISGGSSGSSGASGSSGGGPSGGAGSVAAPQIIPAEQVPAQDLIDYNRVLAVAQGELNEINYGNVFLVVLNLLALGALLFLLWKYDFRFLFQSVREVAAAEAKGQDLASLAALKLSEDQVQALAKLAEHPLGAKLLKKLTNLDLLVLEEVKSFPADALAMVRLVEQKEGEA